MSGHTPGPWTARKHTDTAGWTVSSGNSIASVPPQRGEGEAEANARLIAAAPELLEIVLAVESMARECESCEGSGHQPGCTADDEACHNCGGLGEVIDAAGGEIPAMRAAIAKAKGR